MLNTILFRAETLSDQGKFPENITPKWLNLLIHLKLLNKPSLKFKVSITHSEYATFLYKKMIVLRIPFTY